MNDPTLPLEGLSPMNGKASVARFDGGSLSSDSGLIALAEVEKRFRVAATLAACIAEPRRPEMVSHRLDEMIGFRMCMIAAGYEDANDASRLRTDRKRRLRTMAVRWPPDFGQGDKLVSL